MDIEDKALTPSTESVNSLEPKSLETRLILSYLSQHSEAFCGLQDAMTQGWKSSHGDAYFERQRKAADTAGYQARRSFYELMKRIADELHAATAALSLPGAQPDVLDLCMAPGGYTAAALRYNPRARVASISLPRALGGHEVLVPHGKQDLRVKVWYVDITMLAEEFGAPDIPEQHPDKEHFILDKRPYFGRSFDLVFCDGQVLRTHARSDYRDKTEATRLCCSQLILALQRIKPGGTLIMLLHKLQAWDTITLVHLFDQIAHVQLFKPKSGHAIRGSFYLVAKNVQPGHADAVVAVQGWKETWRAATFPDTGVTEGADVPTIATRGYQEREVVSLLATFGERLVQLGDPIWDIQRHALGKWAAEVGKGKAKPTG